MQRIAICAPGKRIEREQADAVAAVAQVMGGLELWFHPQCYARHGHFAGDDAARLKAFLDCANDPAFDAVWFAAGGYGSNRIAADAIKALSPVAQDKHYLGYSDTGYLLAALYRHGIGQPVHAPMASCIARDGGDAAIRRVLGFVKGDQSGLESGLDEQPTVAFNLITLATLCGTDLMPDLTGHVVLVEEVAEHLYAIDRLLFHVTANLPGIAGLRLGRLNAVPENDRPFGASEETIVRHWCERSGIPFMGLADIGHDSANKIVPFGLAARVLPA